MASVHLDNYLKIIEQQSNNKLGLAVGYYQKATLLKKQRKYDQAIEDYINSLELFRKRLVELKSHDANIQYETRSVDIPLCLYQSMYHIGDIHRVRREYDQALELFNNSLAIAKNLGNSLAIAEALDGIGTVYYEQGEYDKASPNRRLITTEKIVEYISDEPVEVSPNFFFFGHRVGWLAGSSIDTEDTLSFSVSSGVRPMNQVFPLESAAEAFDLMMSGKARFRAVLTTGH
ncbi:MAG: tetratricopeptide repeat protein [Candidatus Nitrosopolaris sp.]